MTGVSSNIMFGQIPACGTGDSEILLDEEVIAAYLKEHPIVEESNEGEVYASVDAAFGSDSYCALSYGWAK
jgi:hypothetical protein